LPEQTRPFVHVVWQVPAWQAWQAPQPIWPPAQQVSVETQVEPQSFNPDRQAPLQG